MRRVFREYVEDGMALRQIARGLSGDGVPWRSGDMKPWNFVAVRQIIVNALYTGEAYANRCKRVPNGKTLHGVTVLRPRSEWVALPDGTVPTIIDRDTCEAAQVKLTLNLATSTRRNKTPERFLLRAGHIFCGDCGESVHALRDKFDRTYYNCARLWRTEPGCTSRNIPAPLIDGAVWARVTAILLLGDVLDDEVTRLTAAPSVEANVVTLDRAIAETTASITNLARALGRAPESVQAVILREMTAYEQQPWALETDRVAIAARREQRSALLDWVAEVRAALRARLGHPDSLTYAQKRHALEALGVVVRVWPTGHTPRFTIEASLPVMPGRLTGVLSPAW